MARFCRPIEARPRSRGAIENGEVETGVTVIRMTPRIDAGGMLAVARTRIDPDETAGELEGRLAELGVPLIAQSIHDLADGRVAPFAQERARVTKAPKLRKEDGRVDWTRPAVSIHDLVRAMQPWPTASTVWRPALDGKPPSRLIVHRTRPIPEHSGGPPGTVLESEPGRLLVAAGSGAVEILEVQPPGKRRDARRRVPPRCPDCPRRPLRAGRMRSERADRSESRRDARNVSAAGKALFHLVGGLRQMHYSRDSTPVRGRGASPCCGS